MKPPSCEEAQTSPSRAITQGLGAAKETAGHSQLPDCTNVDTLSEHLVKPSHAFSKFLTHTTVTSNKVTVIFHH